MPNPPFKERRQSDRIEMVLPIRVQGIDVSGNRFDEETEKYCLMGATILQIIVLSAMGMTAGVKR